MSNSEEMFKNTEFASQLRTKALEIVYLITEIQQDIKRKQVELERNKNRLEKINSLLEFEDEKPVSLTGRPEISTRAGNRKKDYPVRKIQWEGLSVNGIVSRILNENINKAYHYTDLAPEIYEIKSDLDLDKVATNLRSVMQKGIKAKLWDRAFRGKIKAKSTTGQKELANVQLIK